VDGSVDVGEPELFVEHASAATNGAKRKRGERIGAKRLATS